MKLLLIMLSFISISLTAQIRINKTESFNFSIAVDPHASIKEKGLNIGAAIEYSGTIYTRVSITSFSKLQGGYFDAVGSIGLNLTSGYFENIRYYAGGRLGLIKRSSNTYPTAGIEAGINVNLTEQMFVGVRGTYDKRSDFEFFNEPSEMRSSTYLIIGFKF